MTDTSKTLTTTITLLNEKLHFQGNADKNEPVSIDYTPPLGDNLGYTSLELFLLSLSSCAGSAFLVLLRKMNKQVEQFDITSTGNRKENHPTGFASVIMQVRVKSENLSRIEMEKVLEKIEGICPVLSMLDKSIQISFNFIINE